MEIKVFLYAKVRSAQTDAHPENRAGTYFWPRSLYRHVLALLSTLFHLPGI